MRASYPYASFPSASIVACLFLQKGQQACLDPAVPACGLHLIMSALDAPVASTVTEKAVPGFDDAT